MKIRVTHRVRPATPADFIQAQEEAHERLVGTLRRRLYIVDADEPAPRARATGCWLLLLFSALAWAAIIYAAARWGR